MREVDLKSISTALGRGAPLLLFLALTVVIINLANWFVLGAVTTSFEEQLGLRLTTVAQSAVTAATPELLLDPAVSNDYYVRETLSDIALRHGLENVFLVDLEGVTLFDLNEPNFGNRNPFLDLDVSAFERAAGGTPASSRSIRVEGDLLKSGYAPVEYDEEVRAVLGVTAGTGFLERVPALRGTLLGVGIGSAAIVILLGAVFFGMTRRLALAESALARSETLSAMGMMAAGVAHEIRNPLAIISGAASRLKKKYGANEDPLFDFIPDEVQRLNGILEGYLRFARNEPLAFVECDLNEVMKRAASMTRETLEEAHITLQLHGTQTPIPLRADPQRLHQVLLNLLLNSAQAMPNGGVIDMALTADEKHATLTLEDRGRGFSKEDLRNAFEPFRTTKEKGSGLGLALAKRIVEGHGGRIELANRNGGGAVVTLRLPRSPHSRDVEEKHGIHPDR
jgi:signal transduction histidine kinase